ncbi:MAG: hypothetical protein KA205_07395 [Acidobacteria bacterium]|nr:hypothetical protein [Acidobacteriota bacterium]
MFAVISPFIPLPSFFRHPSKIHGQAHVGRVMVHALRLIEATGWEEEAARLWAAVYLHDIERTHDGVCQWHGENAVKRWRKQVPLQDHILSAGVIDDDIEAIELAVTLHCWPDAKLPPRDHPHWRLCALLKDADGLDRVRLGDLNPKFLRLPESAGMIDFAQALFDKSNGVIDEGEGFWDDLIRVAADVP